VGAVSALSITRAFGIVFLGAPRDAAVEAAGAEVSRWMLLPMAVHGLGVVLLGVLPVLGWRWWKAPVRNRPGGLPGVDASAASARRTAGPGRDAVAHRLDRRSASRWPSACCGAGAAAPAGQPAQRHVTWGCGYTAPNPRMQYTGSGFSWDFGRRFQGVMAAAPAEGARRLLPHRRLPAHHCVDAVERRLFNVIKHGDETGQPTCRSAARRRPAAVLRRRLVTLVVIGGLVVLTGGPLQ
jgi:hydrogenase-4 component B